MDVKLSRWGNSLAIRIPAQIANEAFLREGAPLRIEYSDGALHLSPVKRQPTLDELLEGITSENCHTEIDFGNPVGEESWE
ncbi:MAG: AbrB/MazE/SpoVT family DNA-binding domain-containing protein [Verrucomicrobiales bacterium]|jgi:antitoxin MazE|nr:AbrB/MazE/SpoVT family DNA-binding domain-containing protein [Verrucomicrobiales bacterium]MBP9224657.1 AbrB/MazE/SpoVT family DNA-binding domain-containing protein [Verrucomicrobiales bacterium]